MDRLSRKAAVTAYKERKPAPGIFAVTCTATGQRWVGETPTLDTIQNRLWFTLRQGVCPCHSAQEAWAQSGLDSFRFEVLERLDPDEADWGRGGALRRRGQQWRERLAALAI
jgi:hypothetical protein